MLMLLQLGQYLWYRRGSLRLLSILSRWLATARPRRMSRCTGDEPVYASTDVHCEGVTGSPLPASGLATGPELNRRGESALGAAALAAAKKAEPCPSFACISPYSMRPLASRAREQHT